MPLCNNEKTITLNVYPSVCVETWPAATIGHHPTILAGVTDNNSVLSTGFPGNDML